MGLRVVMLVVLGLAACDPGPSPELRARNASDGNRILRYDNAHDNSTPPTSPQDAPPASRKFEKH